MSAQTADPSSTAENAKDMELGELEESATVAAAEKPSNDAEVDASADASTNASADASTDVVVSKDSDSVDKSTMPTDPMF
jgi:hypothetical protein